MSLGVIAYLVDGRPRERAWWALLAPSLLVLVPLALGVDVPRLLANLATMVCCVGPAVLAFRRSRDEPGHGRVLPGLTLLAVPCTFVALVAPHAVPGHYRVLGVMPMLFFGMTLLTVGLLRRRRALEAERWRAARRPSGRCRTRTTRWRRRCRRARNRCRNWCPTWRASTAACRTTCAARWAASRASRGWPATRWAPATSTWCTARWPPSRRRPARPPSSSTRCCSWPAWATPSSRRAPWRWRR